MSFILSLIIKFALHVAALKLSVDLVKEPSTQNNVGRAVGVAAGLTLASWALITSSLMRRAMGPSTPSRMLSVMARRPSTARRPRRPACLEGPH